MSDLGLDTSTEPWVATFPGLGQVLVHHDGQIDTRPDPATDDDLEERRRALHHGWGIPLAHLRLGRRFIAGTALVDPDGHCLVAHGPTDTTTDIALALAHRGWQILGQRLQPVSWDGPTLIAHPTGTPTLIDTRRADRHQLTGTPARADSDSIIVDLPAATTPHPVSGLLKVVERRNHHQPFSVLTGHDRFDACTNITHGEQILSTEPDATPPPQERMAETLRLTALPHVQAAITSIRDRAPADDHHPDPDLDRELAAVLDWWTTTLGGTR